MGGLARRVSYTKIFQAKFPGVPTLTADTGYSMGDGLTEHGEPRPDVRVRNQFVLKSFAEFPMDVVNVSAHDLPFISRVLRGAEPAGDAVVPRMISANIVSELSGAKPLAPLLVKEVRNAKQGGKAVRVAFVGLTAASLAPPPGYRIEDPIAAAKRFVPEARRGADFVVVLAQMKPDEAARLAREVTGIDVVLVSGGDLFTPPLRVGETLIAFTPLETRMLGELRVYRDARGRFTSRARFISLDDRAGEDPAALTLARGQEQAELKTMRELREVMQTWQAAARRRTTRAASSGGPAGGYVSANACAQCHLEEVIKWRNSGHSRANQPLATKEGHFDTACWTCHATGAPANPGLSRESWPPLASVQCEQCHGPGAEHIARPAKGYGRVADMRAQCAACHTERTSPNFDLQAYWERIKH